MSTSPARGRRGAPVRAVLATLAAVLAAALVPDLRTAGGRGHAGRGHGLSDGHLGLRRVFDTSYSHDGMRHTFRGCLVKRGWSRKSYRALKNRQWRLNTHLAGECRVGDYHLSGVRRNTYKRIRVVVFKYRFDYLVPC